MRLVGELRGLRTDKTKLLLTMYARPEKELRRAATEALQVQSIIFYIIWLFLPSYAIFSVVRGASVILSVVCASETVLRQSGGGLPSCSVVQRLTPASVFVFACAALSACCAS